MPLKLFGKSASVGIDLGHRSIRVAQIEKNGGGWRIVKFASVPTPPGAIKDGVVVEVETVAQAIRQALREAHISASSAHVAVSGGTVVVRVVRVPAMAETTLRKSIKYEAGRYVPSSAEDSYIEFEVVGKTEDGQMDILLAAAPKEIVQARMLACQSAGLEVDSVDVEPFAAYRSLVEADPELDLHGQTIALIDIGAAATRMSVIQNGVFTNDLGAAWKSFSELEVGGVIVNDVPTYRIDHMPYGGVKDSGLGREGLRWAVEDMTEVRIMVLAWPS